MPTLLRALLDGAADDLAAETAARRAIAAGWIGGDDSETLRDLLGLPTAGAMPTGAVLDGTRREVISAVVRTAGARALADLAAVAAAVPEVPVVLVMTSWGLGVVAAPAVTLDLAPLRRGFSLTPRKALITWRRGPACNALRAIRCS